MQTSRGKTPQPDSPEQILLELVKEHLTGNLEQTYGSHKLGTEIRQNATKEALAKLDEYYINKFLEIVDDPTKGSKWIPADIRTYKAELRQAIKQLSKRGE